LSDVLFVTTNPSRGKRTRHGVGNRFQNRRKGMMCRIRSAKSIQIIPDNTGNGILKAMRRKHNIEIKNDKINSISTGKAVVARKTLSFILFLEIANIQPILIAFYHAPSSLIRTVFNNNNLK